MPSAQYNLSPGGNTFIAQDNSFAGLEIGDIKEKNFLPQFKLRRWGKNQDECNISFRLGGVLLDQETNPQISQSGNKISWAGERTRVDFYDTGGLQEETGGYEMDITLLVKPASPIIPVTLNVPKNLDFFYQPPLTADEIKEGCVRPEKVVGSYPLYHKSMAGDYTAFGLDNYKAGKFGHIYRPQLIDDNGKKVWGELNIDLVRQLLTVTMPLDFYNSCAWPVKQAAGLEFGYHVVGGSYSYFGVLWTWAAKSYSLPAKNGSLVSISIYGNIRQNSPNFICALYDDNGGQPNNLLASKTISSDAFPVNPNWVITALPYNNIIDNTQYWFGTCGDAIAANYYYDTATQEQARDNHNLWTDPFSPSVWYDRRLSIYAIYNPPAAGGDIPLHLLFPQPQGVF
jgi:hypothetical protein